MSPEGSIYFEKGLLSIPVLQNGRVSSDPDVMVYESKHSALRIDSEYSNSVLMKTSTANQQAA
jgi:hypothetical protein